jgi:hypothetical protein
MRSTNILIFLVALNGAALALGGAGLTADAGFAPTPGGGDQIESANQTAGNIEADKGGAFDTFVGAVISAGSALTSIFSAVTAGPQMLMNLGAPAFVIVPLAAPLYILVGIDLLQVISGRDLS